MEPIFTLNHDGTSYLISEAIYNEFVNKGASSVVTRHNLDFAPFTWDIASKIPVMMAAQGMPEDTADRESYEATRGGILAQLLLKGWNRTQIVDGVEQPLPITPENIKTLPMAVCVEISNRLHATTGKRGLTVEDVLAKLDLEKKASAPTTSNT